MLGLYKMAGGAAALSLGTRGALADMALWAILRLQTRVFASRTYDRRAWHNPCQPVSACSRHDCNTQGLSPATSALLTLLSISRPLRGMLEGRVRLAGSFVADGCVLSTLNVVEARPHSWPAA